MRNQPDVRFQLETLQKQTRIMFIDEQLRDAGWEADTKELDWCNGARPEKGKNKAIAE